MRSFTFRAAATKLAFELNATHDRRRAFCAAVASVKGGSGDQDMAEPQTKEYSTDWCKRVALNQDGLQPVIRSGSVSFRSLEA